MPNRSARPRTFGIRRTMADWRGPRPDWYDGPLRSEEERKSDRAPKRKPKEAKR